MKTVVCILRAEGEFNGGMAQSDLEVTSAAG